MLAFLGQQPDVDDEGQQHVHEHTGNHDDEALPGGLGAKLPGLWRLLHLRLVHRLVHHAGNLVVATQREPPDAVFCLIAAAPVVFGQRAQVDGVISLLFLPVRVPVFRDGVFLRLVGREELEAPLSVHLLATEDGEAPVEEEIELLDTGLEGFGGQEVP